MTSNWDQTGAFDIVFNNASSELSLLESSGDTFFATLDAGDLSGNRTLTLPNATGTIATVDGGQTFTSAVWNGSVVGAQYGGTGVNGGAASNGSLLIGNGSGYSLATLTQGGGISITNGAGTITVAATLGADIDLTTEVTGTLPVANGGTGTTTLTTNGVLYGDGTSAIQVTSAGTNGQLLFGNTGGAPIFATLSADATVTNAGVLTISGDAVALTTDTTGNYIATITDGSGISGGVSSEGGTPTLSINLLDTQDGTGITSSNSGLEFQGGGSNELTLLQGCVQDDVLSWNNTTNEWSCASVSGVGGATASGSTGQVAYFTGTSSLQGENQLNPSRGGTGVDGSSAANGTLLIGNGTGYSIATITDGAGITVTEGSGTLTITATLGTDIDLASEVTGTLPVSSGGTGTTTLTANRVLLGNGTSAVQVTNAGTNGQLLLGVTAGAPAFGTMSGDATITNAGVVSISADSVALSTDTTGNYVATITNGNGISGSSSSEGGTPTIALGDLTADWTQAGAFDIILNNAASEISLLESSGDTFYATLDAGDLTSNRTFTLPNVSGVIATINGGQTFSNAVWNGTIITPQYGGTGIDASVTNNGELLIGNGAGFSLATLTQGSGITITNGSGTITVASTLGTDVDLTTEVTGTLPVGSGGTGVTTFTSNGVLYGNSAGAIQVTSAGTNGQLLFGNTGSAPAFATLSGDASVTSAGVVTISSNAVALTTDTTGNYVATITNGNGISGSSSSEGGTPTLAIDLLDSADGTGSVSSFSGLEFQGTGSNELTLIQGCADSDVLTWDDGASEWSCASISGAGGATASGSTGQVAYFTGTSSLQGENQLNPSRGGTGVDGSSAANGSLLIGNGSGYSLATLTQGTGITITNGSGTITVASTLGTDIDLTTEVTGTLPVANGGTGAATLTANRLLVGNGTGTVQVTNAGTNGQLLLGVTAGTPAFGTMSGDATITNAGIVTIGADAISLTTDTTGNYVATITNGNGISGSSSSEGGTPTLAIDLLDSADGTGSVSSFSGLEFQGTGSNELTLIQGCADSDVLTWDDGASEWSCASISGAGGATASGSTGQVAYFTGTSSLQGENQLNPSRGGTGVDGSSAANGSLLIGNGSGYSLATLTQGSGITVTNGAGSITIASTLVLQSTWLQK